MNEQIIIFFQIIFIDLVLAGDNAIIIGMVASQFPPEQRKKIIFWGIGGAVILRIILTLLTAYLLQINGIRLFGGLALLYICYKLYKDVIAKSSAHKDKISVGNSTFIKAIWTILIADFTMSLDNVLGVAGAAKNHYWLLIFGLALSIILMATAATLISGWIKKYSWIGWVGLIAILVVAIIALYFVRNNYKNYNLKRTISACIFAQKQNSEKFDLEKAKSLCEKKIKQNLKFSE